MLLVLCKVQASGNLTDPKSRNAKARKTDGHTVKSNGIALGVQVPIDHERVMSIPPEHVLASKGRLQGSTACED